MLTRSQSRLANNMVRAYAALGVLLAATGGSAAIRYVNYALYTAAIAAAH